MRVLLAGGAGFIGSHFAKMLAAKQLEKSENVSEIVIVDSLEYAGNLLNIKELVDKNEVTFIKEDIQNYDQIVKVVNGVDLVINFAAQSHVDRSISDPNSFINSNIFGMHSILKASFDHNVQTFIQISTDEVYGSLIEGSAKESDNLLPNSPYAASKASADLIARSYFKTYNYDVRVTRCTNNYGTHQYPEKIIPFFLKRIIENKTLPIYGDGMQIRDWIHVEDHCRGIWLSYLNGSPGEIYNLGSNNEIKNLDLANIIINLTNSEAKIEHVIDRKGHDYRYSLDFTKASREINFMPTIGFEDGIRQTIDWYLNNQEWWDSVSQVSQR
jgi:dTDP-glucose 4,6-dehydratase